MTIFITLLSVLLFLAFGFFVYQTAKNIDEGVAFTFAMSGGFGLAILIAALFSTIPKTNQDLYNSCICRNSTQEIRSDVEKTQNIIDLCKPILKE